MSKFGKKKQKFLRKDIRVNRMLQYWTIFNGRCFADANLQLRYFIFSKPEGCILLAFLPTIYSKKNLSARIRAT